MSNSTQHNGKYLIIANIIFLLALFPYLAPARLSFDTQPWAFAAGVVFLAMFFFKEKLVLPKPIVWLLCVTVYAEIFYLVYSIRGLADPVAGLRSLFGYFSVLIFAFAGYKTYVSLKTELFVAAVTAWFFAGMLQLVYGAQILASILPRLSTGGYRGLTSLAPEPAYYAFFCVTLIVLNEFFYKEQRYSAKMYAGIFCILVLQVILSYSGVGIMLLVLFAGAKFIELCFIAETKKQKRLSFGCLVIISISLFLFTQGTLLGNTRGGYLVKQSVRDPISLLMNDLSISRRIMNPVIGFYGGLVESRGVGFGSGAKTGQPIPAQMAAVLPTQKTFGGRIEGGLSGVVYELGVVGVVYALIIAWIVLASIKRNRRMRPALLASAFAVFVPMCMFGPIAFPFFGYLLGIHLYYLYNDGDTTSASAS